MAQARVAATALLLAGAVWLALVIVTLLAVTAIGFLGYRDIAFRSDLWWNFAWHGDAPRFLRATFALSVAVAALALDGLVNRPLTARARPGTIPQAVRALLADCPQSARQVALLGDKQFLVAPDGRAFLMYGTSGRSWVCLGGPVGDPKAGDALIWELAERADQIGGRLVFHAPPPPHRCASPDHSCASWAATLASCGLSGILGVCQDFGSDPCRHSPCCSPFFCCPWPRPHRRRGARWMWSCFLRSMFLAR